MRLWRFEKNGGKLLFFIAKINGGGVEPAS
jgi:hypothetical protein